ncbi:MAG: glutamine--fructose-6-phosphate transaminase (isomerizing) [Nitrosopumilaceae archaeon]|nr:glutamine--fructose-6-phosphate transaminase (isomerizing) [Nitrosopumilaceae archaeon]NIU00507.1 glutamine--fructose-6-phosphate transaminase (isomerizing) [Nitrosopumilaceae archaeon]NIU86890.1 glutamine--fructose-6-phosphate transaminase (isomerizing) [Nitrosopumilaceae archaeon]NIV65570.1 glutamine--fructose-6-phosphate transaminase (isomerizing) [Nitrosopumilaceae archaeon]NIX61109.1 glutamine--fructose-6-phosphate transaminase (isomerizing) [Nitrosopumilaceae archaeon]
MCSIIGYSGLEDAAPILVRGLKRMEYRGYDSVGVATSSKNNIDLKKGVGKVAEVNQAHQLDKLVGNSGVGHTRWATHGKVTDVNAHPHKCNSGTIAIVHNGIIENYDELKDGLKKDGFTFDSETDTEIIANLLQKYYEDDNVADAMLKTVSKLKGNYSFVAMFENGKLAAARNHEPLIIGVGKKSYFVSSDVLGFIEHTDEAIYVENKNLVIIDKSKMQIFDFEGKPIKYQITKVSKEFGDVYKGDFAHFTLKEISEQPDSIIKSGKLTNEAITKAADYIRHAKNIYITGSGTSYNAALIAKYLFSKYAKIKIEPIISSELQFAPDSIEPNSILLAVSQSGESADVLEAINLAKKNNVKVISIVNILTSSLVRESDITIGMNCGPEIGVAATKSFTSQLAIFYKITEELCKNCLDIDFDKVSILISKILEDHNNIKDISKELKDISDIYILGRGIHFPIATEAALKLKELAYIHAEGIPGGELKHGPLALMDTNVYVIVVNPNDATYNDTLTSAREIKTRGAKIIGISDKKSDVYDYWIEIPSVKESLYPLLEIVPIQLLAYYSAIEKEEDPDYPRNLAKSVTVK